MEVKLSYASLITYNISNAWLEKDSISLNDVTA